MIFRPFARFRTEEVVFSLIAVSSILIKEESNVPTIVGPLLLAFYYLVFSWYLFPVGEEKYIFFSILSSVLFAICLISIAINSGKLYDGFFFYYLQTILLVPFLIFLFFKKNWYMYKKNHLIRVAVIVLLNVYILIQTLI